MAKNNQNDPEFELEENLEDQIPENSSLSDKLKKLREELKICQTDKTEYLAGWQRAKADYLNFKSCSDFMAFHDVEILHRSTNVKKLWEEIKKEYPNNTMEFFNKSPDFQTTLGIGVLLKTQPKVMA